MTPLNLTGRKGREIEERNCRLSLKTRLVMSRIERESHEVSSQICC